MAAKTFQCVICQAEVSKPQSYAYKDGRACRHHPEVQENHSVSEEAKKADLKQSKQRAENPGLRYGLKDHQQEPYEMLKQFGIKNPNEHCWCCHKEGVYEYIIAQRYLVNMSKAELRSSEPVSPFEIKDGAITHNQQVRDAVRKELGEDKVALRRIPVTSEYPGWKLSQVLNPKGKQDKVQLVRMTEMIVLCKDCATQYEFPWEYFSDRSKLPDFKGMFMIGQLVKPVIDSVAAGEIAAEEISSIMSK